MAINAMSQMQQIHVSMAHARYRGVNQDIMSITIHASWTAPQTADRMARSVMSQMQQIHAPTDHARLHVTPTITYITTHVKKTPRQTADPMAINAIPQM
jgi:hypothetical protein